MNKIDILSCTDSTFVIPLGVMFYSICANAQNCQFCFHVIVDKSVTDKQKKQLAQTVKNKGITIFYEITEETIGIKLPVVSYKFPISIYYRLLMAKILPPTIDKVLYLDADIIVRHDLSELWKTNIDNYAIAAVVNQSNAFNYWNRLDYPRSNGYINSGVILVNLAYWRTHFITEQFLECISTYKDTLYYPDQDVINRVLNDKIFILKETYNTQEAFFKEVRDDIACETPNGVDMAIKDPCVLHYTGVKPWELLCQHPLIKEYYKYKRKSLWKDNIYMETKWFKSFRIFKNEIRRILFSIVGKKVIYKNINIQ